MANKTQTNMCSTSGTSTLLERETCANGGRFAAPVLIIKCPYFRIVGTRQGALIFSEIRPRNRNLRRRQAAQTKPSLRTVDALRVG